MSAHFEDLLRTFILIMRIKLLEGQAQAAQAVVQAAGIAAHRTAVPAEDILQLATAAPVGMARRADRIKEALAAESLTEVVLAVAIRVQATVALVAATTVEAPL